MLEIEDSQEFVWEIVEDVVANSIKIVYDKYIQRQTIPYTINEARKAILHILDVRLRILFISACANTYNQLTFI